MEMHLVTAWLSICCCYCLALGLRRDEDEDEALLHSHKSGSSRVRDSCGGAVSAFGYPELHKQLELKLEFQPQRPQLLRSSNSDAERLLHYKGLTESARDVSYKKSRTKPAAASVEDYDDNNDDAAPDDDNDKETDDDDAFTERVSCIIRTIWKNTKLLADDVKALDAGLLQAKASAGRQTPSSKPTAIKQRPKQLNYLRIHQNDYMDMEDSDAALGLDTAEEQSLESLDELSTKQQSRAAAEQQIRQADANEALYRYLQLPLAVPSARMIVPPLLQLLTRRSALPCSGNEPKLRESRRYLQALDELRLARAVQAASAASAASLQQRHNKLHLQQHVGAFNENLRRLLTNQAAIEQRVSSLLSSNTHNAMAD